MTHETSNKPTGMTCKNCHRPVLQCQESTFLETVGWTIRKRAHCDCSLGLYKTNITRPGLVRFFWKGINA